ncbi:hypothetical protein LX83_006082 [Goodfellowiella coeruleoviolacea]|uniref:Uncharacterized protein n=2 Tax=Goodfellowiella coeruleoviolacea TaxID=334858 RepID=A0AAE3GNE1_9PSEU|nr:hypothetical protein [Goodfellowiella coeruleoviolacea]
MKAGRINTAYEWWLRVCAERRARNERLWPSWRNQRRRRLLVRAWAACVLIALAFVYVGLSSVVAVFAWLAVELVVLFLYSALKVLTRQVTDVPRRLADERELALRNRYAYTGYLTGSWCLVVMMAALLPGVASDGAHGLDANQLYCLALGLLLLTTGVPTAQLAWTMPDDDPEDLADPEDLKVLTQADQGGQPRG